MREGDTELDHDVGWAEALLSGQSATRAERAAFSTRAIP